MYELDGIKFKDLIKHFNQTGYLTKKQICQKVAPIIEKEVNERLPKELCAKAAITDKNEVYLENWVKDENKSLEQAAIEMRNQFANNKRKGGFLLLSDEQIESLF